MYSIPPAAKQERQSPPALLHAPSRSVLHVLEALHDISRSTIPDRLDSAPVTTFKTPLFLLNCGHGAFSSYEPLFLVPEPYGKNRSVVRGSYRQLWKRYVPPWCAS